MPDLLG